MNTLPRELIFKILDDNTDIDKIITVLECSNIELYKAELDEFSRKFKLPLVNDIHQLRALHGLPIEDLIAY